MSETLTSRSRARSLLLAGLAALLPACNGERDFLAQPPPLDNVVDPRTVLGFDALYGANCAGCHGAHGRGGLAIGLASPTYLAMVSDADLRAVIADGRPKTSMPAFAVSAGGTLTSAQVGALVAGVRAWAPPDTRRDPLASACKSPASSDVESGARMFGERCGKCHGADGRGNPERGSVVEASFLDLISDASLCTTILAGRPDLGCSGARGDDEASITAADVSNTVAWISSHRQRSAGESYRSAQAEANKP
jgi:cytochrome c oxidase cbb3-type subunit 3